MICGRLLQETLKQASHEASYATGMVYATQRRWPYKGFFVGSRTGKVSSNGLYCQHNSPNDSRSIVFIYVRFVISTLLHTVNSTGTTHSCIYAMHYVQICTIPALSLAQGKDLIVPICVRGKAEA